MLKIAIQNSTLFEINYIEAGKKNIFYTIDTIKKIRKKIGYLQPLGFIIGEDNLQNICSWKNWKKIIFHVHIIVYPRIHIKKNNSELKKWIDLHIIDDIQQLHKKSFGYIFFSKSKLINISSSEIRKNYLQKKSSVNLLSPHVHEYIISKKIYDN